MCGPWVSIIVAADDEGQEEEEEEAGRVPVAVAARLSSISREMTCSRRSAMMDWWRSRSASRERRAEVSSWSNCGWWGRESVCGEEREAES